MEHAIIVLSGLFVFGVVIAVMEFVVLPLAVAHNNAKFMRELKLYEEKLESSDEGQ